MSFSRPLFITINGLRICYRMAGSGSPLLLLHGFNESSELFWDNLIPVMANRWQILAPDFPGYGHSAKPKNGYSVERQAQFVERFAASFGFSSVTILGHSFGGLVGARVAARHRLAVKRLILYGTPIVGGPERSMRLMLRLRSLIPLIALVSAPVLGRLLFRLRSAAITELVTRAAGIVHDPDHNLTPTYVAIMMQSSYEAFVGTIFGAGLGSNLGADLRKAAVPVLFVYGQDDPFVVPEEAASLPFIAQDVQVAAIPCAAHVPLLEEPQGFLRVLEPFLAGQ
jgi:pimeloyl-ACP methyl ester carboxylesterase